MTNTDLNNIVELFKKLSDIGYSCAEVFKNDGEISTSQFLKGESNAYEVATWILTKPDFRAKFEKIFEGET